MKKNYILGISCFYHDSAAALILDGEILSAVQEERFTRKKHDSRFPKNSIIYCLKKNKIDLRDIKFITYYEKPLLTFKRLIETYIAISPRGMRSFISAMKVWLREKLFLKSILKKELKFIQNELFPSSNLEIPKILFTEHHQSHAAAAYYPSPFKESAILCMDGVGEWATTSAWIGKGNKILPLWQINFPHSLGLLYSAFTDYCGFKVNSGEYKLMGLAPYGNPKYCEVIKEKLVDIKSDGSFKLNMSYFKFHRGFRMTSRKFEDLFGRSARDNKDKITQFHMDMAASIQKVTEEIVIKLAKSLYKETGIKNLCLAGGVALNCVANGKLLKANIFDDIWIQPASGDAGSALGAALLTWHDYQNKERSPDPNDSMKGSYLGCEFSNDEIISYLTSIKATFIEFKDKELFEKLADLLDQGKVIGWFNGPMEFGPRALGGRSIIGDPRNQKMQSIMNLKIKYRESFRPFAPSVLEEDINNQFEMDIKSPYMLLVSPVKKELCLEMTKEQKDLFGIEKLGIPRSSLPAITHIDYSARVQTVSKKTNPRYYNLINAFKHKTGCPIVINTSFNVRGEPIVNTPTDAFNCFMGTGLDLLIVEDFVLKKSDQNSNLIESYENKYELD